MKKVLNLLFLFSLISGSLTLDLKIDIPSHVNPVASKLISESEYQSIKRVNPFSMSLDVKIIGLKELMNRQIPLFRVIAATSITILQNPIRTDFGVGIELEYRFPDDFFSKLMNYMESNVLTRETTFPSYFTTQIQRNNGSFEHVTTYTKDMNDIWRLQKAYKVAWTGRHGFRGIFAVERYGMEFESWKGDVIADLQFSSETTDALKFGPASGNWRSVFLKEWNTFHTHVIQFMPWAIQQYMGKQFAQILENTQVSLQRLAEDQVKKVFGPIETIPERLITAQAKISLTKIINDKIAPTVTEVIQSCVSQKLEEQVSTGELSKLVTETVHTQMKQRWNDIINTQVTERLNQILDTQIWERVHQLLDSDQFSNELLQYVIQQRNTRTNKRDGKRSREISHTKTQTHPSQPLPALMQSSLKGEVNPMTIFPSTPDGRSDPIGGRRIDSVPGMNPAPIPNTGAGPSLVEEPKTYGIPQLGSFENIPESIGRHRMRLANTGGASGSGSLSQSGSLSSLLEAIHNNQWRQPISLSPFYEIPGFDSPFDHMSETGTLNKPTLLDPEVSHMNQGFEFHPGGYQTSTSRQSLPYDSRFMSNADQRLIEHPGQTSTTQTRSSLGPGNMETSMTRRNPSLMTSSGPEESKQSSKNSKQ